MARFVSNYLADDWNSAGAIIILGGTKSKVSTIEAFVNASGQIIAELVETQANGSQERIDIIGPDITRAAADVEKVRKKILNNLWYWDGKGRFERKQMKPVPFETQSHQPLTLNLQQQQLTWGLKTTGFSITLK